MIKAVVDSLRRGDWPWWNPYQYAGLPVFGDPQAMLFSLHTMAGLMLGKHYTLHVFDIITLGYLWIGGVAIYALGYGRGVPRVWLLSAAVVFMIGGVATCRLQHMTQIMTYAWLPLLLWMILRLFEKPAIWRALMLGLIGAFWAANANQVVVLGGIFLIFSAIYLVFLAKNRFRLFSSYLVAGVVTALLLLPIYAAILEVVSISVRAKFTLADSAVASFPPMVFVSLILPAVFGNLDRVIWSPTSITQDFFYIGVMPLVLYGLAIMKGISWRKPLILSWLAALAFFILFSLGVNAPVHPFLFEYVPGFDLFRRPADAAYLINFFLAAGLLILGREAALPENPASVLTSRLPIPKGKILAVILVMAMPIATFTLGGFAQLKGAMYVLQASYVGLLARLVVMVVLLVALMRLQVALGRFFPTAALVILGMFWSIEIGLAGRYWGFFSPAYAENWLAQTYLATDQSDENSLDEWLRSHTQPWSRVEIIGGHQSLGHSSAVQWHHTQGYNPIKLQRYAENLGAFKTVQEPRTFPELCEGPLDRRYDVLGLRYVAIPEWLLKPGKNDSPVAIQARKYRDLLAENGGEMEFRADSFEVWKRPGQPLWLAMAPTASFDDLKPAPCQLLGYGNSRLQVVCAMAYPTTLVMGEVYAPGWLACINGEPSTITPYLGVFRSLELPAGKSEIIMNYHPVPFMRYHSCEVI